MDNYAEGGMQAAQMGRAANRYAEVAVPTSVGDDVPAGVVIVDTLNATDELLSRLLMIVESLTGVSMGMKEPQTAPAQLTGTLPMMRARAYEIRKRVGRAHDGLGILESQLGVR